MDTIDYSIFVDGRRTYPGVGTIIGLQYTVLAACGELGELANELKKVLRDDGGQVSSKRYSKLVEEAGDILWYVTAIARELELGLGDLARANMEKLRLREAEKGV